MRPLLSLCMMVKDEAASIRQVLEAARPFVDQWTILDTGSVDGTQNIVREVLADIPGDLYEEPFIGYAESRNRVLALQKEDDGTPDGAIFTLMLSGDEHLREGQALREALEGFRDSGPDAFRIRLLMDDTIGSPIRIFRTATTGHQGWHYEDAGLGVHEFETHPDPMAPIGDLPGVIEHIVSDPQRRMENIWEMHIPLLRAALQDHPEHPRALLFLAQSLESLFAGFSPGERITYAMEAMSLYMRRLQLPFTNDIERNFVRFRFLEDAKHAGIFTHVELYTRVAELAEEDPYRPEVALFHAHCAMKVRPLKDVYELAAKAAEVAEKSMGIANQTPVSVAIAWQAHHLAAVAVKQMAKRSTGEFSAACVDLLKGHVAAGLAAGGPKMLFEGLDEIPAETSALSS